MTATQARQNFFDLLEVAEKPGRAVTITREGHPSVVVLSVEEYEGWLETLEIMGDPMLVRAIRTGMREKKAVPLEDLARGRHAAPHAIRRRPQAKRGKGVRKSA